MNNKNPFNRKSLKIFRSSLRNKSTSAEVANQPPRPQINFAIKKSALYCGHPSFKRRGELYCVASPAKRGMGVGEID